MSLKIPDSVRKEQRRQALECAKDFYALAEMRFYGPGRTTLYVEEQTKKTYRIIRHLWRLDTLDDVVGLL